MQLCTLASGSKGNASLIQSGKSRFLVDVGLSSKKLVALLESLGKEVEGLSGIFITHEHRDHILGLKTFLKKYNVPVFATSGTFDGILSTPGFSDINKTFFHPIEKERPLKLGDMEVIPFEIPHDAKDPVGFCFTNEDKKVAICTDIGKITDCILHHLTGANALVLEANHDEHILQAGRYPYSLKKRILGDRGHLSNENSGKLLATIWNENLKNVILGHLSEENNMPELALLSVKCELSEKHKEYENYTKICVASQTEVSECVYI